MANTLITTPDEYHQATTALRTAVGQMGETLEQDVKSMTEFLRYRAAKQQFFPHHPDDDRTFYLESQYNIQLSAQLEHRMDRGLLLSQATAEGDTAFVQQQGRQAYIFCTFHFGSYQMVGAMLRQLGFDFSVLTLREGITADMLHQAGGSEQIDVLHADSPSVMLEMHSVLQSGKSLMAFIDGNPEVISEADRKSYAHVDILGHQLLAKKGIPSLSYATGVPIVPIVSYRTGHGEVRVTFGPPIWPNRALPRATYVQQALQTCYGLLEHYLLARPEQWLYWRMIHNYLALPDKAAPPAAAPGPPSHYTFNQERYELYQAGAHSYLYDRRTQEAFAISGNLLAYLRHIGRTPDKAEAVAVRVNPALRQELLGKHILHAAHLPLAVATP